VEQRPFTYVSNQDVRAILTPADAVRIARDTLVEHARGQVDWGDPRQANVKVRQSPTHYKMKGCVLHGIGVAGFRVVGLRRTDEGYAVAAHRPTKSVLLSDPLTGAFFGIVDERWAYGLRTGACAAVAIEALMVPDATDLTIIGTGHMAYATVQTVNEIMPLERIRVFSRSQDRREAFAARLAQDLGITVEVMDSVEAAVRDAAVIVTATEAAQPIIHHEWLRPGAVVYAMGTNQECDTASYDRMRFIADERQQIEVCFEIKRWIEEGTYDPSMIEGDLAEVITGKIRRESADDQFLVRSQGLVTQDVAQAYWIYQQAVERGLGVDLEASLVDDFGADLF
jgi:alanine dehydrogenase